jgi:hypothetical protein
MNLQNSVAAAAWKDTPKINMAHLLAGGAWFDSTEAGTRLESKRPFESAAPEPVSSPVGSDLCPPLGANTRSHLDCSSPSTIG